MGIQRKNATRVAKRQTLRRNPLRQTRHSISATTAEPIVTGPKIRRAAQKVQTPPKGNRAWRERSYLREHEHREDDEGQDEDRMDEDDDSDDLPHFPRTRSSKKPRPFQLRPPRWGADADGLPHMGAIGCCSDTESDLEESGSEGQDVPSSPDAAFKHTPTKKRPRKATSTVAKKQAQHSGNASAATQPSQAASIIPDWQGRLEYFHWVRILSYAAAAPGPFGVNANWLLQTARVCKALADPAMTVLYWCPPLRTELDVVNLIKLLRRPPTRVKFNYRPKIRSLYLDISAISISPDTFASPMNLIRFLPLLTEIHCVHPRMDGPPYRNLDQSFRWHYSRDIFQALEATASPDASVENGDKTSPTRLESWIWNKRMLGKGYVDGIQRIQQIHSMPSFAYLRKMQFVNFQTPSWKTGPPKTEADQDLIDAQDKAYIDSVAEALAPLKCLEHLVFESSTLANSTLLQRLPYGLKHVEFINCWEITSEDFTRFLHTQGHRMETLALHHNQSLDLSFLTSLGSACPNLKELRMNLLYYRHHEALDDSDPFYDHLILQDQLPIWPSSLQVIDLDYLRQWSPDAADMFFQSLADSAEKLPDLRHLSVKGMLNIPWRQRSEFRRQWQDKLGKIYLRPVVAPEPVRSIHHYSAQDVSLEVPKRPRTKMTPRKPSRHSNRLASHASVSGPRTSSKSKGLRSIGRMKYEEPDSDEFDHEDRDSSPEKMSGVEASSPSGSSVVQANSLAGTVDGHYVQGMCNVVEINIDNQKPREHRYNMDDFLNSEGDETDDDWNGANEYE